MFRRLLLVTTPLLAVLLAFPAQPVAAAGPRTIGPGVQMITAGRQCTANFVFRDSRRRLFLGYAASCATRRGASTADGCATDSRALGTRVRFVTGATSTSRGRTIGWGTLRYSSWIALRRDGTATADQCRTNNFALVRVDRANRRQVDPTVPFWGGPAALGGVPAVDTRVFTVGRASAQSRVASPKAGAVSAAAARWATVFSPLPGVPGDRGAGLLDAGGRAFGVLTEVGATGNNGVESLEQQVLFARRHGMGTLRLVTGREPFSPSAVF